MVRQTKHDRDKQVTPEFIARNLAVPMLNHHVAPKRSRLANRIRELIGLLQEADVLFPKLRAVVDARDRISEPDHRNALGLARRINTLLRHQRAIPQVVTYLGPLSIRWTPTKSWNTDTDKIDVSAEYTITKLLIDLVDAKLIASLRQCNCKKYFLARSSLTRFCSTDCRVKFWEESEERKQKKREKAREYYMLHKAGIVKGSRSRHKSK